MSITRVSDNLAYSFLVDRAQRLQVQIRSLQEQISTGKRLLTPDADPIGASQVVRSTTTLAALGQYEESSRFGAEALGSQDKALGQGVDLMVRAEELATELSSSSHTQSERDAAAEEVHGLLQAMTTLGNSDLAGRRLFGGLALDASAPFADPDAPGYTAATAYSGSTQEFEVRTGPAATDQVRISTRGDQVFGSALQALEDLETTLRTPGADVAANLASLAAGRETLDQQRASVGARESHLLGLIDQTQSTTVQETTRRSGLQDADFTVVVTQLLQAQQALQAVLSMHAKISDTNLASLLGT